MELDCIMLSEISQSEKDISCFHSYVDLEKFNRRPWGRGKGKKLQRGREANYKRLLDTKNKLRVDRRERERGKRVMGTEEGTCWNEHWVLYGSDESQKSTPKPRAHCLHCMSANVTITE